MDFKQVLTGEAFLFLAETVDPDGLEAEVGRSADVPGIGREEEDFTCFGFELFDSKLVDPWVGLKTPTSSAERTESISFSRPELLTPEASILGEPLERIAIPKP